jgi:hypothetical protein
VCKLLVRYASQFYMRLNAVLVLGGRLGSYCHGFELPALDFILCPKCIHLFSCTYGQNFYAL